MELEDFTICGKCGALVLPDLSIDHSDWHEGLTLEVLGELNRIAGRVQRARTENSPGRAR